LQMYQMYLKLMIDGVTSTPFSARGMAPIPRPERSYVQEIIASSREQFARARPFVEEDIRNWHIEKIKPIGPDGQFIEPTSGSGFRGQGQDHVQSAGSQGAGNQSFRQKNERSSSGSERNDRPRENRDRDRNRDGNKDRQTQNPSMGNREQGGIHSQTARSSDSGDRNRDAHRNTNRDTVRENRDSRENRDMALRENRDRDNRESERRLREAVSLNYLKDRKEEEVKAKNDQKNAKPQNILALKEALLGILGEDAPKQADVAKDLGIEIAPPEHTKNEHTKKHSDDAEDFIPLHKLSFDRSGMAQAREQDKQNRPSSAMHSPSSSLSSSSTPPLPHTSTPVSSIATPSEQSTQIEKTEKVDNPQKVKEEIKVNIEAKKETVTTEEKEVPAIKEIDSEDLLKVLRS